jgi:hypothetical protein
MRKLFLLALLLTLFFTAQTFAWFNLSLDEPIDRLADNSAIDIVYDGTYIWLGTGNGLSGTRNGGQSWITFNKSTGFDQSSISALATHDGRLWAATSHDITGEGGSQIPAGGGLEITDDFGASFQLVNPKQLSSAGMLCYDLSVYDSSVWAACYYGGLLRSLDRGETWENIFIDDSVKNDYENQEFSLLRGRYFSTAVDPYHDDSVVVWAGSAEGVQRIYYIGKSKKLASNRINDISYDGKFWWYATDKGVSRLDDTLFSLFTDTVITTHTFLTYDTSNGLQGNFISAVGAEDNLICLGIYDTLAESSLGMAVSTNGGATWTTRQPEQAMGQNRKIEDVEVYGGYIWAGCGEGGFIRSADDGETWHNLYFDSTNTDLNDPRNVNHGFEISDRDDYTKALVGSDSGVVTFYFTDLTTLDSTGYMPAEDNVSYGQKIVSVASVVVNDIEQVWAAAHPKNDASEAPYAVIKSIPGLPVWDAFLNAGEQIVPYQVEILKLQSTISIWVAHNYGLYESDDFGVNWYSPWLRDRISHYPNTIVVSDDEPFLSVEAGGDHLHVGSLSAGALEMVIPISDWFLFPAQTDPLQFDLVGRSYRTGSLTDTSTTNITGNFVTALGVQRTGDSTIIWASTKPTTTGYIGVSITTDRGRTWRDVATGIEVWNYAFNGDTTFLAAEQGLYVSTDFGEVWSKYSIYNPNTGQSIADDVPVYAVKLIDGVIWAGTADGIAKSSDGIEWEIFRQFNEIDPGASDDNRSYVTPNPFSPYISAGPIKFHYYLRNGGDVTIKIYDFANNLVRVVTDREFRAGGQQQDDLDLWDGKNGNGDIVAGGVYIYVIESSGGDELWGKLMVLP